MKSFLAAAIALSILLFPISLASQASKWSPPLTPDGKPDLQGVWLNQSATPLERPKELAGREFLTDEEVAEFKRRAARLFDVTTDSDFPGGDNFFLALLANPEKYGTGTSGTSNATVMIERTIDNRTSLIVDPPDGRIPPMTPDGSARLARTPPCSERITNSNNTENRACGSRNCCRSWPPSWTRSRSCRDFTPRRSITIPRPFS